MEAAPKPPRPTRTRSFSAALFLIGRGFVPTVGSTGEPVYVFAPEAAIALDEYFLAKDKLDALTDGRRVR